MTQRCLNPRNPSYPYYGGRGIAVCGRWLPHPPPDGTGYYNFLEDMGERPEGMTLDRIDPDGNYEPSNCRWATRATQSQNVRNADLTWDLVNEIRENAHLPRRALANRYGISYQHVRNILLNEAWIVPEVTWAEGPRMRKVTSSEVAAIRSMTGMTHQQIADLFGVSKSVVTRLRSRT
jgi:DNA-binding transcriptional regulator YiaG